MPFSPVWSFFHTITLQIVVKPLPGSGLKVPGPPDKLTFSIAYCQTEMGMLVILNSHTVTYTAIMDTASCRVNVSDGSNGNGAEGPAVTALSGAGLRPCVMWLTN